MKLSKAEIMARAGEIYIDSAPPNREGDYRYYWDAERVSSEEINTCIALAVRRMSD